MPSHNLCRKRSWGLRAAKRCLAAALAVLMVAASPCLGSDDEPPASAAPPARSRGPSRRANRLARETSPYLLMHAHNPVDWYPWSPEIFEKARREVKPIFLSIGYSSCHWCHVMERQVFENDAVARKMNDNFVCVKVDREERPDVDDVYMTAFLVYSQAIGSGEGGGWPLSMFLTPEGKPFAGGTFFPLKDTDGRMGFPTVLARVTDFWKNKRDVVEKNADALAAEVGRVMRPGANLTPVKLEPQLVSAATKALIDSRDPEFGGVDFNPAAPNAAKFPEPAKLALLENDAQRHHNAQAAEVLALTLDHIAAGGIRDHLAGGFHRYSTDRRWHVPHFEKMLYDQAQLAARYADAFRRTGKPIYRRVAEETFDFVLDEMTEPAGGFVSAIDAETDGVEGGYYVWSSSEIDSMLGGEDARLFKRVYGLGDPKTFELGYVLHLPATTDAVASELGVAPEDLESRLEAMRAKLLARRRQRPPVPRDDKIVAGWNGLMIASLARGGAILKRDNYVRSAAKAAVFLLAHLRNERGELLRTYRSNQAKIPAYLEDYAYFTDGLLALYEATRDEKWLRASKALCDEQVRLFWDKEAKGFYFTSQNHDALIARTRNAFDAVLPSANSVSARNLLKLANYTRDPRYRNLARETLEAFAPALAKAPRSLPQLALALDEYLSGSERNAAQPPARQGESEFDGSVVQTGAESAAERARARDAVVSARAYLSVDKLPPGGTCEFVVFVSIKEGWHINTNQVEEDWRIPTELLIDSKRGVKLVHATYAKGKPTRGERRPIMAYEKETIIRGTLRVPEDAAGQADELRIVLKFQACNNRGECQPPDKVKLVGRVPVAPDRESVHQINGNLFAKLPK